MTRVEQTTTTVVTCPMPPVVPTLAAVLVRSAKKTFNHDADKGNRTKVEINRVVNDDFIIILC